MRDIALTMLIFGLLPVCFTRPWVGFVVWTWFGLMNPHRLTFGFAYTFPFGLLIGAATLVGLLLTRDKKPVPWNLQLVLMMLLLAYFTFTSFFAWVPESAWAKLEQVIKVVGMAILTTMVIYGRERIRWLLIVIALSIGYYGIKGGIWVMLTGGGESVQGPDRSFISQSNGIGVALIMVVPLLLALAREEPRRWVRWFFNVAAGLNVISAVFTYSRGAMLGVAAITPFIFTRFKKKFWAAMLLVPLVLVGIQYAPDKLFKRAETIETYQEDGSSQQRFMTWSVAWNIALERPFVGAGFDFEDSRNNARWISYAAPHLQHLSEWSLAAHSIYFQILGQHGFIALGLYLLLLLTTLWKCNQLRKRTAGNPELDWIGNYASAIGICLIGYMVSGAFLSTAYFDLAWIYYSFTAILGREVAEHGVAARSKITPVNSLRPQLQRRPLAGVQLESRRSKF